MDSNSPRAASLKMLRLAVSFLSAQTGPPRRNTLLLDRLSRRTSQRNQRVAGRYAFAEV